eukprot:403353088
MPKTAASIFQVVGKKDLKNLESNFFISPLLARNVIYCCSALYFVFCMGYLMLGYSFQFHEGFKYSNISNIIYSVSALVLIGSIFIYVVLTRNGSINYFQDIYFQECSDASSQISAINKQYTEASEFLCSEKCPCTLFKPEQYPQYLIQKLNLTQQGTYGSQFVQNCGSMYFDWDHQYFAQQMKTLELDYQCSGFCQALDLYVYSNINNGMPKRSCVKAMIDSLQKMSNIIALNGLLLGVISVVNCMFIYVLQSRYILLVDDEDLFGKDSEGDVDDDNISMYSKYNGSTIDTNRFDKLKQETPKQLNLDINKTLMSRRMLNQQNMINKNTTLPLPLIVEKKESGILDGLIANLSPTLHYQKSDDQYLTPKSIPKSTQDTIIIRPYGKTFANGMAMTYSYDDYDSNLLLSLMSKSDYEFIIEEINNHIFSRYPCVGCQMFAYFCCLCTAGLSCVVPYLQVREAERACRNKIKAINQKLTPKFIKLELRVENHTSYIIMYLPSHKIWKKKHETNASSNTQVN